MIICKWWKNLLQYTCILGIKQHIIRWCMPHSVTIYFFLFQNLLQMFWSFEECNILGKIVENIVMRKQWKRDLYFKLNEEKILVLTLPRIIIWVMSQSYHFKEIWFYNKRIPQSWTISICNLFHENHCKVL